MSSFISKSSLKSLKFDTELRWKSNIEINSSFVFLAFILLNRVQRISSLWVMKNGSESYNDFAWSDNMTAPVLIFIVAASTINIVLRAS